MTMRLRRDGGLPRRVDGGDLRLHRPEKPPSDLKEKQQAGLEICVCEGCNLGPIDLQPIMAVLKFTTGHLRYRKFGPLFEETLRFFDGRRHKFAHSICAYDHGITVDNLKMHECALPGCPHGQFFCEREPKECCLLVEQGYFHSMKGGLFVRFVPEKRVVVHWACARDEWKQSLLTEEFNEDLHDVDPS